MRHVPMLVLFLGATVACQAEGPKRGYLGESAGTLEIDGETRAFDGGALEFQDADGLRTVILTTNGFHFTCDWALGQWSVRGGENIDRPGTHWDLFWKEVDPGSGQVMESVQGLFGGGDYLPKGQIQTEVALDQDGYGTMETNRGDLEFETHLCDGEIVF